MKKYQAKVQETGCKTHTAGHSWYSEHATLSVPATYLQNAGNDFRQVLSPD